LEGEPCKLFDETLKNLSDIHPMSSNRLPRLFSADRLNASPHMRLIIVCDPLLFGGRVGFVGYHLCATEASVPAFLSEPSDRLNESGKLAGR
jgi:hypothetical protein